MKHSTAMFVVVALAATACGPSGAGNLQDAGATADANLATAGPAVETAGAEAGDVAATAAAGAGKIGATMGAAADDASATAQAMLDNRLVARVWQWVETTGTAGGTTTPADPSVYNITFLPGGAIAVKADCKLVGGTYTADETAMTLDVEVTTTDACAADSLADAFVAQLEQVASGIVGDDALTLGLADDGGTMRFEAR